MHVRWTEPAPDEATLAALRVRLQGGAVLIYPTETLYGLGCDPQQAGAAARIARLKGRDDGKAMPLVAASPAAARALVRLPDADEALWNAVAASCWPGPVTLVAPARPGLAPAVLAGGSTVAVRVSAHPVARHVAALCGGAVVATSANRSGAPPTRRFSGLDPALRAAVDLLVDGGDCPEKRPSTVVRLREGQLVVLREGAVSAARLQELELPVVPSG